VDGAFDVEVQELIEVLEKVLLTCDNVARVSEW
jgi:hypothetical protein